jgi:large-conductance mechanosensitive channel
MKAHKLFKILMWRDLLPLSMAVYFGTVLQRFFESLVNNIIIPIMLSVIPESANINFIKKNKHKTDLSDFSLKLLTLLISVIIIYFVIKSIIKFI